MGDVPKEPTSKSSKMNGKGEWENVLGWVKYSLRPSNLHFDPPWTSWIQRQER